MKVNATVFVEIEKSAFMWLNESTLKKALKRVIKEKLIQLPFMYNVGKIEVKKWGK